MGEDKDIKPKDNNGKNHGYQEWYYDDDIRLWMRCNYKHGREIGYEEWHDARQTRYYIR